MIVSLVAGTTIIDTNSIQTILVLLLSIGNRFVNSHGSFVSIRFDLSFDILGVVSSSFSILDRVPIPLAIDQRGTFVNSRKRALSSLFDSHPR